MVSVPELINEMKPIAVIVARFQVPELNPGYRKLIQHLLAQHDKVAVVLGAAATPGSAENPLNVAARKHMIQQAFPTMKVLSLKDHPLDEAWSRELDELLDKNFPTNTIIYGTVEGVINRYSGKYNTAEIGIYKDGETEIPERFDSVEFREGVVHAYYTGYPKVYPTVDVAVFRKDKKELLLGKKKSDNKWRLIGGFVDPSDADFAAAAKRELQEECGDIQVSKMRYEGSFKIDDWRYRYERDKIISTLFSTDLISGDPVASDDIAELKWVEFRAVKSQMTNGDTAPEHGEMLRHLLSVFLFED